MEYRWTRRDWAEFEKEYPSAYQFLLSRSLFNEYRQLATNVLILNDWQKNRLRELEEILGYTWEDVGKANALDTLYRAA